jgi:hypothetical protein
MIIAFIFLFIFLVMIYVYSGLKLVENIKTEQMKIYFWLAYIIFGITLINIIAISKYWSNLSTKIGPPGPRGARGDDGDIGPDGICTKDTNLVYTNKEIKNTILLTIKDNYKDLANDDILDETTLKLTNNYLNYRIKLMITSKQFETILTTPSDDNSPKKITDGNKIYGKTIEDLTGYLCSIWKEWINGLINVDKVNAKTFFITYDAQIDISPDIQNYFNTEIMKYDIWYWGATRVFRPLEAEICRSEYENSNGKKFANTRYPVNNRSKLDIIELEFTDNNIVNDDRFIKILDLNMNSTSSNANNIIKNYKYNEKDNKTYDIISRYENPKIYLPKVYTVPTTKQKYYPIGFIMVNGNNKTNIKRKTILVSGDIIIPNSYEKIWDNLIKLNDKFKIYYTYKRKRGLRKTEYKRKTRNYNETYDLYLTDHIINKNNSYTIVNNSIKNTKLDIKDNNKKIEFYKFKSNIDNYTFLGDIPAYIGSNGMNKLLKLINFNDIDKYSGPVAIPNKCLEKTENNSLEWSFRHNNIFNKNYNETRDRKIPKPRGESRFNKSYTIRDKKLKRKLHSHKYVDIIKNNLYNILNFLTDSNKPIIYNIKDKCYKPTVYPIKDIDKKYNDLGFGWFGYPMKKYRKYSIFAYLGLMPEGIIVHRVSGRKFYIKHYGGVDPNKFLIYLWSETKKDFKNAITVKNNTTCYIGIAKKTDPRCQFRVILDKNDTNFFRLEPLEYPNKYLKMSFDVNLNANLMKNPNDVDDESLKKYRPKGLNLDHTEIYLTLSSVLGKLEPRNPLIFFNQPTTGTNMQIVKEDMPRNIDRSKSSQEQYEQQLMLDRTNKSSFDYLHKDNKPVELLDHEYNKSNLNYTSTNIY